MAGLEDGDIIIGIGDKTVKDIYDYKDGLGMYEAGDKTTLRVKRGTKVLEKKVQF